MTPPRPARIGRYEIEAELGRGMMGVVYQARDPELGRTVALKTVSLAFAVSEADRDAFNTRFLEEARIAARLSHPGIVIVHEVGRDPQSGTLYIALEHLRGSTLADVAGGGRTMPWRDAVRVASQVARALHHAHGHGVVHRDVKPANIMLLESGQAKVLDFGVARAPASQLTAAGQFFGTPAYMSPEQVAGSPLDGRSDVFSLGCVLYVALTGRRPFDGDSVPLILARVTHTIPPPPSQVIPGVPDVVDGVVARAMAKEAAARYADASALADDLDAVLDGRAPRAPPVPHVTGTLVSRPKELVEAVAPPPPLALRRRALLGAGAAVLAIGAWLAWPRGSAPPPDPDGGSADTAAATEGGGFSWRGPFAPAHLAVDFDHHLRSGTVEIWVDDDLVLEEPIEGRVTHKVLSFRLRRGSLKETLEVSPGLHQVRVQVSWEGRRRTARLSGQFKGGATRRLEVSVARLTRELSLEWR